MKREEDWRPIRGTGVPEGSRIDLITGKFWSPDQQAEPNETTNTEDDVVHQSILQPGAAANDSVDSAA